MNISHLAQALLFLWVAEGVSAKLLKQKNFIKQE